MKKDRKWLFHGEQRALRARLTDSLTHDRIDAVGPPPGLVAPKMNITQGESTSTQSPNHSGASHMPQRLTSGPGSVKYGRMLLLKLAASPLVPERPADMPAFDSWFG